MICILYLSLAFIKFDATTLHTGSHFNVNLENYVLFKYRMKMNCRRDFLIPSIEGTTWKNAG